MTATIRPVLRAKRLGGRRVIGGAIAAVTLGLVCPQAQATAISNVNVAGSQSYVGCLSTHLCVLAGAGYNRSSGRAVSGARVRTARWSVTSPSPAAPPKA